MSRLRRGLREVPRVVWLITVAHAALLFSYSVLFASFRGPDEPQHTDLIRYVRVEADYPAFDERNLGEPVVEALDEVRFDVPAVRSRDLPADGAPERAARPSFSALGSDLETVAAEANQLPSHPPLYYGLAAAVVSGVDLAVPGEFAFDEEVGILRLFGALLVLPLPLLAWATARRIGAHRPAAVAAAVVPLAIPQLHHIGASVTNDNLLTLLVGVATLLCVRIATGDSTRRTAVAIGLVAGAALLTKAFALFLPLMIAAAYAIALRRGARWRVVAGNLSVAAVLSVAAGGWWWFRNLLVFGKVQTGIKLLDAAPEGFEPDVAWWLSRYLRYMPWRFWGWFGWFDVAIPAVVATAATLAVVVALALVLVRPGRRTERKDVLLGLVPIAAIATMVAIGAFQGYLRTSFDEGLQGRYLFPGLVGLAAAVGLAVGRRRWGPLALFGVAGLMQVVAVFTILRFYWGGSAILGEIRAAAAWAPWPPPVLLAVGIALAIAAVATSVELSRLSHRSKTSA